MKRIGISKTPPKSEARPLGTPRSKSKLKVVTKEKSANTKKEVDTVIEPVVVSSKDETGSHPTEENQGAEAVQPVSSTLPPAIPPELCRSSIMNLSLKGLSKNGKRAIYVGAAISIAIGVGAFPSKQAPSTLEVSGLAEKVAKTPRAKMSKEERKALPKPTLAEKIARREAANERDKAKLAAQSAAM
jgi:hypothetical protein